MSETAGYPHSTVQCLTAIAQHHGVQVNPERLIDQFALGAAEPSDARVLKMAQELGLKAQARRMSWDELLAQQGVFPILARRRDGGSLIVVGPGGGDTAALALLDPLQTPAQVQRVERADFEQHCAGDVILLKRQYALLDPNQPFGLRWFIPEILRQKVAFRDIAIAAVAMHLLALATPIFFQLVIDRVLAHQNMSTLWVLGVGVVAALTFDAMLGYVRQLLTLVAGNKIDLRLTRRAFAHLLSLPIDYFETSTAGVITRHMQQLESIRQFLTGRLFFTGLDATALLIFLPLLFAYSVKLAMIVLAFTLLIMAIMFALLPIFRRRLNELYIAEAHRQSLLVETVHGMRTVKSLAIEPTQRKSWDQFSAHAINRHYRVGEISIIGASMTDYLGKLLPIVVIIIGAQAVFTNELSVGALIAFQMLSGRVVQPLIQIVGLINEYQQTAISVKMLGEIMNRPPEGRGGLAGLRPQLSGELSFEDVTFRYPGASQTALDGASFRIPAGAVIGIVGRSGSGKTTLTKLIQGLYPVQEGLIRFDGIDAREIDLAHLRRQVGVVLQENFLFRGTVRQNICATRPDASFEEVVAAAQAAGADEFIERLPQGYDTLLEENAANLSGGQKQRLSIARSLIAKPRILILDEAASALDPESETIFIRNLSKIAVGRTVIMISHRLSTLVNAHAILVMQQGRLIDSGSHRELLGRCEVYQTLWQQQTSHL